MFATWMIGFLLLMMAIIWVAVVIGISQPYLGLVVLVLVGVGAVAAVVAARRQRPRR